MAATVILLQRLGPALPRPHADRVRSSRHAHMLSDQHLASLREEGLLDG